MKKIFILMLITVNVLFNDIHAQITATQVGMLDFKVDQNLTEADMNGTNDVTAKLQAAVNNAREAYKSLFIPSGTYKVSKTIDCIIDQNVSPQKPTNIIGSSVNHPLIKVVDNATTCFNNAANPQAVFTYHTNYPGHSTDYVMEGGIRGLDFDLGANNKGAVAIYWGCAQYCYIEDININAREGFAGLTSIGGANCLFSNITVTGGRYGVYLPGTNEATTWNMPVSPHSTMSACSFINQTENAMFLYTWGGITLVGINIVKPSGTAIYMNAQAWCLACMFHLSMIDTKVEFTNPQEVNCAISNPRQGTVSLRGFYAKGAGTICANNADENILHQDLLTDWTYVKRYNYISKSDLLDGAGTIYAGTHYDAVTGTQFNTAVLEKSSATPPANLISQHVWATTPSFEDPDAFLVPAGSSAAVIQSAIDAHQKVCLAAGTYLLSKSITLKSNTILFGCPGRGNCGAILKYDWYPLSQTWLIKTANDAAATTYLMDIATAGCASENFRGSLNWMAGANSIIRDVWFDMTWSQYEKNLIRLYFSGNGGGRVFNYQDEKNLGVDPNTTGNSTYHRKVKVYGTTQPLTFYGLNLERGGGYAGSESTFPLIEMKNASNVRIFGAKSETYQPYALIDNCKNIFLTNILDYANIHVTQQNYIEIVGTASDKIEITNTIFLKPLNTDYLIVKDPWNTNTPDRTMCAGLYHRNWTDMGLFASIKETTQASDWSVYPNPTKSVFYVQSALTDLSAFQALIFNVFGNLVKKVEISDSQTKIDLSDQMNGLYVLAIQNSTGLLEKFKIIKN